MGNRCCKGICLRSNSQKKIVLLLVGLDNAGKTTTAKGLAGDIDDFTIPTVGFSAIKPKTILHCDVTIYDLGGGVQIRDIWTSYFHCVHGVIYVVDASDLSRIEESKTILENLLLNEKLAGKPVLVLANKQDQANALDEIDIVELLQLEPLVNQQKCHTLVKICSAIPVSPSKNQIDKRLLQGYKWLLNQVLKDYDIINGRVIADSIAEAERFEAQRALQRKRYEELEKETENVNGFDGNNHVEMNGISSDSKSTDYNHVNLTSTIRDQLEQKYERQRFMLTRGRRSNKVHPKNHENIEDLKGSSSTSFINSQSSEETSMTLRALTSPLHNNGGMPLPPVRRYNRPTTSRSLGCEVGVWGLEREMDIIYPAQVTRHIVSGDGVKEDIVVEYLKD